VTPIRFTTQDDPSILPALAFSPDGRLLAGNGADTLVRVWRVPEGRELFVWPGHTDVVVHLAWSPDGRHLATGSQDETIKVWDLTTGRESRTFQGHRGAVQAVAFSPDGRRLASASLDKTVKVWDLATGEESLTLRGHSDAVYTLAFSPDGLRLASAGSDGVVLVWDARPMNPEVRQEAEMRRGNRLAASVLLHHRRQGDHFLSLRHAVGEQGRRQEGAPGRRLPRPRQALRSTRRSGPATRCCWRRRSDGSSLVPEVWKSDLYHFARLIFREAGVPAVPRQHDGAGLALRADLHQPEAPTALGGDGR
jgi:hypothetical protein